MRFKLPNRASNLRHQLGRHEWAAVKPMLLNKPRGVFDAPYSVITDGVDTGPASGRSSIAIMPMAAMASMTVAAP